MPSARSLRSLAAWCVVAFTVFGRGDVARAQEASDPASASSAPASTIGASSSSEASSSSGAEPARAPGDGVGLRLTRIAVYDLEATDIDARVANIVTDAVIDEIRKLKSASVIGMREVTAMLDAEASKQLMGCGEDSCLAEIADALGVDVLVIGGVARVGDKSVFGLRRINQLEARVTGSFSRHLTPGKGEEFLAVVGDAVAELFADMPLLEGRVRGVPPEIAARLDPPPLPTWPFIGVAALSAVALGSGALLGAVNAGAWFTYTRVLDEGRSVGVTKGSIENARLAVDGTAVLAWTFFSVGALSTVALLVLWPFTDFAGVNDEVRE